MVDFDSCAWNLRGQNDIRNLDGKDALYIASQRVKYFPRKAPPCVGFDYVTSYPQSSRVKRIPSIYEVEASNFHTPLRPFNDVIVAYSRVDIRTRLDA